MKDMKLWYTEEAKDFTEALPFGNGSFGGMAYGRLPEEKISLNSDTLWSGCSTREEHKIDQGLLDQVRQLTFDGQFGKAEHLIEEEMLGFFNESYMPMGTLSYRYGHLGHISDYERCLNLDEGTIETSFMSDGTRIKSLLFASYPDQMVVLKLSADGPDQLDVRFDLTSKLKYDLVAEVDKLVLTGLAPTHVEPSYVPSDNPVVYDEMNKGIKFVTALKMMKTDGITQLKNNQLIVNEASFIEVALATANGFVKYNQPLIEDIRSIKAACYETFSDKGFDTLLNNHQDDYKELFDRVTFSLEELNPTNVPTNQMLTNLKNGEGDLSLFTLYFQYGRYLMISSSRPGSQASNLQGIWNEEIRPPWSSNYTVNINTQMNYWMTNGANLIECAEPLVDMVTELSEQGQITAKEQFHTRGWVTNHNVDLWRQTGPVGGKAKYAFWPMGGVWLTANLVNQYLYTKDASFLMDRVYPILKGSALFCSDWLVKGVDGKYHTCPSTSPENEFYTSEGHISSVSYSSTMDMTLIKELFNNFLMVADQYDVDSDLRTTIKAQLQNLPDTVVGDDGCIQEWILPFEEVEKGHRHFTPIYGLHPGRTINVYETPDLLEGARRFIEKRLSHGGGHTGWSCAWLISMYARLGEGEKANDYLTDLLAHSSYNNLFDLHPPLGEVLLGDHGVFQIDGNFGGVEGIMAMLVQSHLGEIDLLPALPNAWHSGNISGVLLEGGFELAMEWKEHQLVNARIEAKVDNLLKVHYKLPITIRSKGVIIGKVSDQRETIEVSAKKGQLYNVDLKEQ